MILAGHLIHMAKLINAHKIVVGKSEEKRPLGMTEH
jgi:hypothetical protein